jgi:hypothetical protein
MAAMNARTRQEVGWSACWLALGALALALAPQRAAAAAPGRTVELILDASGSMNARLADGTPRIDAARAALGDLVEALPAETVIALRVYGADSPRSKHDCADTRLVVPFGAVGAVKGKVAAAAAGLKAQGYTPITRVLELAAADFPADGGERVIVLVSDGIETCEGDPCATARALAGARVRTLVHTVGFGADEAAIAQLRCIASVTGGRHFGASDAGQLAAALAEAVAAKGEPVQEEQGMGAVGVRGADLKGSTVIDAATGAEVGRLGHTRESMPVPAGIYNVTIGKTAWKSVRVRPGETTWLEPAILTIEHASLSGHDVLDRETGEVVAEASAIAETVALMPGTYDVRFGGAVWPGVELRAGQRTVLRPGVIEVRRATINGHTIRDARGAEVGKVSATGSVRPFPPGTYTVELKSGPRSVTLAEGQRVVLENS